MFPSQPRQFFIAWIPVTGKGTLGVSSSFLDPAAQGRHVQTKVPGNLFLRQTTLGDKLDRFDLELTGVRFPY